MEEDMSQLSFRDDVWLQYYSLNSVSVLDYFSFSGFYDRTCNNEMVKMQRQSVLKMKEMVGIEYEVVVPPPKYFDDPFGQKCVVQQTSNLFVIQKQYRHTPDQVSSLAVYYCLYGSIYQGPHLLPVLHCRIQNAMYYLKQAIEHDIDMMNEKANTQDASSLSSAETQRNREGPVSLEHSKAVDAVLSSLMTEFPMDLNS